MRPTVNIVNVVNVVQRSQLELQTYAPKNCVHDNPNRGPGDSNELLTAEGTQKGRREVTLRHSESSGQC
jgi:hypothetical protein